MLKINDFYYIYLDEYKKLYLYFFYKYIKYFFKAF